MGYDGLPNPGNDECAEITIEVCGYVSPDAFNQWLGTLHGRNVSVHALVIKSGNGMPEVVARAAAQTTSGLFQTITPGSPIAEAMQKVASRISETMHR